jgi:hypothetical protein
MEHEVVSFSLSPQGKLFTRNRIAVANPPNMCKYTQAGGMRC